MPRGFRERAVIEHYGSNIADLQSVYNGGWEPFFVLKGMPGYRTPGGTVWPALGEDTASFTRGTTATVIRDGLVQGISSGNARIGDDGLLVEPQATNNLLDSEDFSSGNWSDVNTPNVTTNDQDKPASASYDNVFSTTSDADKIEDDNGSNFEGRKQTVTVTDDSTAHTAQVFMREDTADADPSVRLEFTGGTTTLDYEVRWDQSADSAEDVGSDTADDVGIISLEDGWRLLYVVGSNNGTGNTNAEVTVRPVRSAGSNTGSTHFWGAQLTNTPHPVSYYPTGSSAQTRNADSLTFSFTQSFDGTNGLTLYARITPNGNEWPSGSQQNIIAVRDDTPDNQQLIRTVTGGSSVQVTIEDAGTLSSDSIDPGHEGQDTLEIMFNSDSSDHDAAYSVNEGSVTTDEVSGVGQTLDGGESFTTVDVEPFGGHIDTIAVVNGKHSLSDMRTFH